MDKYTLDQNYCTGSNLALEGIVVKLLHEKTRNVVEVPMTRTGIA